MLKKLVSLLLVCMLLCPVCAAVAESPDLADIEPTISPVPKGLPEIELKNSSYGRNPNADIVSSSDKVYTVIASEAKYTLDLSPFPSILCFTQDILASLESYMLAVDDTDWGMFVQDLIDNQIHFQLVDIETGLMVNIYSVGQDTLSSVIGNFSDLPESDQLLVSRKIGMDDVQTIGSNTWMILTQEELGGLVTIVNGYYISVAFGGSGSIQDDRTDTVAILGKLTLQ